MGDHRAPGLTSIDHTKPDCTDAVIDVAENPVRRVATLGRQVSARWSAAGRIRRTLTEVAARSLTDLDVDGFSASDLLLWAASSDLPAQHDADNFGQPPLILHDEGDFYIQALTWMDGTTSIHEHSFDGAFKVAVGSSLHVEHRFETQETLAEGAITCGDLTQLAPEVLRPGDVRPIEPGGNFIHALFHLERPSVTLVVRNRSARLDRPQYSYRAPGLGWDDLWSDKVWARKLRSIDSAARLDPAAAFKALRRIAAEAPLWEAFWLVDNWSARAGWGEDLHELVAQLTKRAASLSVLGSVYANEDHVRRILGRRGLLSAPNQRLLLALLANLPEDAAVCQVLQDVYPTADPVDLLGEWIAELTGPALRGVSGLRLTPERISELRGARNAGTLLTELRSAWGASRSAADLIA